MQDLTPRLSKIAKIKYVWYADKPPRLGGIPRKISIAELHAIVGTTFVFTDSIYSSKLLQLNLTGLQNQNKMQAAILNRLRNPLYDKMVICYMGPEVGYGVFAREKIALGEIVAIYSGELKEKASETAASDLSYCLDVDTFTGQGNYHVDAKKRGGIARFFQHLPLNRNYLADKILESFNEKPALISTYMQLMTASDNFSEAERKQHVDGMTFDILHNKGKRFREMLNYQSEQEQGRVDQDWEIKHIEFHKKNLEVAYKTLSMETVIIDNTPIVYFRAEYNLAEGDQLGFSYGIGTWANVGLLPHLFDTRGAMISRSYYVYQKLPLAVVTTIGTRLFAFDKKNYYQRLNNPEPVKFSPFAQPISFFYIRNQLSVNNMISDVNLPMAEPNTFTLELIKLFGKAFKIQSYERYPESINNNEKCIVDVVCQAKSKSQWLVLATILKCSSLRSNCLYFESTQEIVIRGVNVNSKNAHQFIKAFYPEDNSQNENLKTAAKLTHLH